MSSLVPFLVTALLIWSPNSFSAEVLSIKGNRYIDSFAEAKRILPKIFKGHQVTLYCGCRYYGKEVNMNSCESYSPGQNARFKKLEWEHVVPASAFKAVVKSWAAGDPICGSRKKGRKCAEKASPLFRQMEGDLYNLWPESGGINGVRGNKPPAEKVSREVASFGKCETVVGKEEFAPRKQVRGDIARTYFYMADAYEIPLNEKEKKMFQVWSDADPVDAWECERARRIKAIQGNSNKFIEEPCLKLKL
jgi:deoxyribonuclease-1